MSDTSVEIWNGCRSKTPAFPFGMAAKKILPGWDISLAFVGEKRALLLNKGLRGKDYIPNVLSYAPGKHSGEIVICLTAARKQAPSYGLTYTKMVGLLFIHALLHLEGTHHGSTMERKEREILSQFIKTPKLNVTKNRSRN